MDDHRSADLMFEAGQHGDFYDNQMISNGSNSGIISPHHDVNNWQRMPNQSHLSYNGGNVYNGQVVDDQFSERESNVANPLDDRFSDAESSVAGNVQGGLIASSRNGSAINYQPGQATGDIMHSRDFQFPTTQNGVFMPRLPSSLADNQQHSTHLPSLLSPSLTGSQLLDSKWRNPDLREVIDYLSHENDAVKVNAAAYLQHLTYMDDNIKAQTRVLRGIPALLDLAQHPLLDVHRAACGALRNLSYGKANDDNKREIKNDGGIPKLVRLLRTTTDSEVYELVTGILWNLSSCSDLKRFVIDDSLKTLVDYIVKPAAELDQNSARHKTDYKSPVFRNTSGILRNVSSDGEYARRKLRDCDGFVDALFVVVRAAISNGDMDNKCVENCICILRNLSFACQEAIDPEYLKKRAANTGSKPQEETSGCFGQKKKKATVKDGKALSSNGANTTQLLFRKKEKALWQPDVVHVYLPILRDCNNPDTLEAAAGAIQNLTAGDWQPAADIRITVRHEKGLPVIVELLALNSDRVVCAAATALRNLALDQKNKELIGKYAIPQLVAKLPASNRPHEFLLSNDTITAVESALYEVIKTNSTHAKSLLNEGGVDRLRYIVLSPPNMYSEKAVRFASQLLAKMWQYTEFHEEYKNRGWREADFVGLKSLPTSADSTLTRGGRGKAPSSSHMVSNSADSIAMSQQELRQAPPPYAQHAALSSSNGRPAYINMVQPPPATRVVQPDGRMNPGGSYNAENDPPFYNSPGNQRRSARHQNYRSQDSLDISTAPASQFVNDANINYVAEVRPRYNVDHTNLDNTRYRQFQDDEDGTRLAADNSYNLPTSSLNMLHITNRNTPSGEDVLGSRQQFDLDRTNLEPVYAHIRRDSLRGDVLQYDNQTASHNRTNDVDSWV